jgi:hypothetical protein
LKKIYDKKIRQLLIPSIFSKENIIKISKNAIKIGFYKISLVINNNFEIDEKIIYS